MGMLADGTVANPCETFLQLTNLLYCGQLLQNITRIAGYFVSWKGEAGV